MSNIKLIVGLGNPGPKYIDTRHNAGEWVINKLVNQNQQSLKPENKFFGYYGKINIANQPIHLLIPTTFMNLSGKAVLAVANFYQIMPDQILVIHDELDLPPGISKFKQGGGHGGHNGLKDIINKLSNHNDFYRLRIGIGHPGDRNKVIDYVLNKPSNQEFDLIEQSIDYAIKGIDILITQGFDSAQNYLNGIKI